LISTFDFSDNRIQMQRASVAAALKFYKSVADWKVMMTLTFKDEISHDPAWNKWRYLVKRLNKKLFGSHYTQKVHHSYFSYLMGVEFQRRGVEHFHVLVNRSVDFATIKDLWFAIAGLSQVELVKDRSDALQYVTKYILKGGEIICYKNQTPLLQPPHPPIWWS
jgi:hypothetical protein